MSYFNERPPRPRDLAAHLADLADGLGRLSARVREAVAEAVGEALGGAAKDLLRQGAFHHLLSAPPDHRAAAEDEWPYEDDDRWQGPYGRARDEDFDGHASTMPASTAPLAAGAVGLGLQAAGWWLYRRGTWWSALGVGLLAAGPALTGGRFAVTALRLAGRLHEVLALQQSLGLARRLGGG